MLKVFTALLLLSTVAFGQSASDQGDPNRDAQWSLENEQVEAESVEEARDPASEEVPAEDVPAQEEGQ